MKSLAVYCGSGQGNDPGYAEAAGELGRLLAERGIELVYGGGRVGLMGAVADGVLAAGGRAIGVIPQKLVDREVAHTGLSELIVVDTMAERKATMIERADAFAALPGGAGTLEEIFEAWTGLQLGYHAKPSSFLNTAGFWSELLAALQSMRERGFVRGPYLDSLVVAETPAELLDQLARWQPPEVGWLPLK